MIKIKHEDPIHPSYAQSGEMVTEIHVDTGLAEYDALVDELLGYAEVLTGHIEPPLESPYLTLAEVAYAYHARAREIEMRIYNLENNGAVRRGDQLYKLRTGFLQSFIEMTRKAYDLGSRRLTQEQILSSQRLA